MSVVYLPFYAVPLLYVLIQYCVAKRLCATTNVPGICLVAIFAVVAWVLFHLLLEPLYGNFLLFKILSVPSWVKCPFPHPKCEAGDVDGWSLYHLLDHFFAGLFFPHVSVEVYFVFFQSLLCEFGELVAGERARFLVDPGVNVLGYMLGCCVAWRRSVGGGREEGVGGGEAGVNENEEVRRGKKRSGVNNTQ